MEISDQLRCLFSSTVEEQEDSYILDVPKQEVRKGDLEQGDTYRVAILSEPSTDSADSTDSAETDTRPDPERDTSEPPVEEGERRTVEIADLGDQGDGLTRVERGFVVIVPETEMGERVTVEITDVRENVAFAEVIKRLDYYD